MWIKILGTRGEIAESSPRHRKQSGVLINGDLLLDLGDPRYLNVRPKWVLITHLHPDHAFFMRRGDQEELSTNAQIYAPEPSLPLIKVLKRKTQIGPYSVIPIPTHHSKHVRSQAYLIKKGKISILYTGDLIWIDKKYHRLFGKLDLVITEGSFIREGGMIRRDKATQQIYGHTGIPNLIRLFCPYASKILFMHFGSWFYRSPKASRKKLLDLGKKYQIPVLIGYDGMDLSIDS